MEFHWKVIIQNSDLLVQGVIMTFQIILISLFVGVIFGSVICAARLSKFNLLAKLPRVTFFSFDLRQR